ncbi:MAG: 2-isopropylmalate synthase [Polyangiaceae bacterium]
MPSDDQESPGPPRSQPRATHGLLFDWNAAARPAHAPGVVDETLRDGLQSPSAKDPPIARKLELLRRAAGLGIDCFALGFPASHRRQYDDALRLAQEVARERLPIEVCCAARTLEADILPIIELSQRAGLRVQVGMFIGSSPIRQTTEGWDVAQVLRLSETALELALRNGLEVLYVTEDSTRSHPETLRQLYQAAVRAGAQRVCVADTVGQATPEGASRIVSFVRDIVSELDPRVSVEWHGHRDRGLDVANCLAAWLAGAARCHGTALGIGERVGNAPIELLLVNLALLEWRRFDLTGLPDYVQAAASALGFEVPAQHPVVGADAFRTATGAHAAALSKALSLGDRWLADRVFSSVPAEWLGRAQRLDVGPFSGEANVAAWLSAHGIEPSLANVRRLLDAAKQANAVLSEAEISKLLGPELVRTSPER